MSEPLEMSINEASGCADIFAGIVDIGIIYDPAEARRIIAAVNACAGSETDGLEEMNERGLTLAQLAALYAKSKQQRYDLLALVKRYRNETPLGHQPHMIAHLADEAIVAAEKQP